MGQPVVLNLATRQLVHAAAIANPTGGATVDAESRTATNAILAALRLRGVVAGQVQLNVSQGWNAATNQVVLTGAIAAPTGGATIDANARTSINSIRVVLQNAGIIGGATTTLGAHSFDEDSSSLTIGAAIPNVAAGGTVDPETRTALNAALVGMRSAGLIPAD